MHYVIDMDWTPAEDAAAATEGWCISYTGRALGHPEYEIERVDEAGVFQYDDDAWRWVIAGVVAEVPLCVRALRYLIINAPDAVVEMLTTLFSKEEDDEDDHADG